MTRRLHIIMITRWLSRLMVAVAIVVFVVGCADPAARKIPVVSVSIEPQRWLLEQIVGDKMEVRSLMGNGGNPEHYEPTFSHLANLEKSVAYFQVGNLGFESAIMEKVQANNPDLPIYCVSDSIRMILDTHHHDHHKDSEECLAYDPHTWSSVKNAKIMAANMLRGMKEVDADNAAYYTRNFITLSHKLDSLDLMLTEKLAPVCGGSFIVWHPSLSYFARDYGIEQIAFNVENKETSPVRLRSQLDYARSRRVGAFIVPAGIDKDKVAVVATGLGLEPVSVNLMSADWERQMFSVIDALIGEPATKTQHK